MSGVVLDGLANRQDIGRFVAEYLEQNPLADSAVDGLTSALQPSPWTPLTLGPSWAEYGEGFAPPAWRTVFGGSCVELRGIVKIAIAIGNPWLVATLPSNVAPKYKHNFVVQDAISGVAVLTVLSDGQVQRTVGAGSATGDEYFCLDPVIFPVGG